MQGSEDDYRLNQKVPLGHHFYGWGPAGRVEYNDEFSWGGFNPKMYNWDQSRGKIERRDHFFGPTTIINGQEVWDRREHTDFGKQFDSGNLMLLDINVGADGAREDYTQGVGIGSQPTAPPTGMPQEWIYEMTGVWDMDNVRKHCAKYPGAGIVKYQGGDTVHGEGVYKQCCFQGDICQLEYEAARAGVDPSKLGKGWSAAKDPDYGWEHYTNTTRNAHEGAPIYNPVADAGMLVWTAPLGAAAELGGAAAFGGGVATDIIGASTSAARPAAAAIAVDVLGSAGEDLGSAGEDVGQILSGVVKGAGEDIPEGADAVEPEPAEGAEVPETPEETTPEPEEEAPAKPKPIHQVIAQAVGDVAGAYLPDNYPTSSAAPSITSPLSVELKQPDRHAPVSDDSIKFEGVLIAVVGITAGALILRHYWPSK